MDDVSLNILKSEITDIEIRTGTVNKIIDEFVQVLDTVVI